jgi:hypothetical protein
MRTEDPLASEPDVELHQIAERIKIFRDSELQPAAHLRLVEMFAEKGISLHVGCSANTPSSLSTKFDSSFSRYFEGHVVLGSPTFTVYAITNRIGSVRLPLRLTR